jgi:hypothetical protein
MPYKLIQLNDNKYAVMNMINGKTYSSHGMSKKNAEAQLRILTTSEPTQSYALGGVITKDHTFNPRMATFKVPVDKIDNIPILAQEGELMIPKIHVEKVKQFLREKQIKLPGM